ncbi:MAG: histidine kinase [Sediminibacterium sp.]|nr:histidine kinase [Sediminibacterium sp.]
MKNWINKIYRNLYFILFIMLFAYVQSIYVRLSGMCEINAYTFTPEALFLAGYQVGTLYIIIHTLIKNRQKPDLFSTREMLKIFGFSLVIYLVVMKTIGFLVSFSFDTIERNFNRKTFFFSLFSDFLNGFIYGSFILSYYFYHKSREHQQKLAVYHQALSENKIHQLKAQLNPHFLFNNLNILDQLIEEDKNKASVFLNEFADIYRYVLRSSERKIISLNEEINFIEQYFRLLQYKYGNAYQILLNSKNNDGSIVPLTLQLLIENAVYHNLGTEENPVLISINISDKISVVNNINLKRSSRSTNKCALKNLTEQYKLLTKEPVEIYQADNTFSVTIPIIHNSVI